MAYRVADIPRLIRRFEAARQLLDTSNEYENTYLCYALRDSAGEDYHAMFRARELVMDALKYASVLEDYPGNIGNMYYMPTYDRRQARVAWCDKIIADLKRYQKKYKK